MAIKPYILVVEDEEALALLIRYNLEKEGFDVKCVSNGDDALDSIEKRIPDLVVLDWMLPEMSGIEVSNELHAMEYTKDVPIIILTARSQESDRLKGFSVGADDYMTKPFSPKELIARIKSVLKRARPALMENELSYNGLKVDNARKCILANDMKLDLSPLEYNFLNFLLSKPERVHSRETLIRNVWGDESSAESRTVDVCVRRLRGEIQRVAPGLENMIKTVRGEGYILEK